MTPTFQDEVQLAGWSETHTGGAKVTFWLPDAAALDTFRTLTARKGNTAGHRFACVLVEIGDDEQPVQPTLAVKENVKNIPEIIPEKPRGGEWAKLAGMWCEDKDFQKFLSSNGYVCRNDIEASEAIRRICRIGSRAELDHDPRALAEFNNCFRHPFMKWMQARGIHK